MSKFFEVKECRICNSTNLKKYLDLGEMPLANALVDLSSKEKDLFFPLQLLFCKNCFLTQLSVVVNPEILFSNYPYQTSISSTFQKHFFEMSKEVAKLFPKKNECLVLDIASNDGCLLEQFKKTGFKVLGVEPAKNLAKIAEEKGIPTIPEFWNEGVREKIISNYGKPLVVTATNVFAHVHDVKSFAENVKEVLTTDGVFILEFPYALNLFEKTEFDTIYHEHLSYFLVHPLITLFNGLEMQVFNIQEIPIHGGSIRVFVKKSENKKIKVNEKVINEFLEREKKHGLNEFKSYASFAVKVGKVKKAFTNLLNKLKGEKKFVAGFAAAAKASTLMHYCKVGKEHIRFIIDDAPFKQNKAFSGNRVPIYSRARLADNPDYLILFAWTIAGELIKKTRERGFKGKFIIPIPFPRIILSESELL